MVSDKIGWPTPAGSYLSLRLSDETHLSLQVIKRFLPFTKSQVYLVRPEPVNGLPSEIILKVYDPRYLDDRIPPPTTHLIPRVWTLEAEILAARHRQEIVDGKLTDEFTVDLLYGEEEAEPHFWEEHFFRLLKECWQSEVDALNRLKPLQGTIVPKLYGSGNIIPPANTRGIQPLAALIEYIPGTPLADVEAGKLNIPPAVVHPLLEGVKKLKGLGVFHSDINDHNILASPSENPTRLVLIDFGCAGVRRDEESDEDWNSNVEFYGDEKSLRRVLESCEATRTR
jgi:serine/threonine protein kinase